MSGQADLGDALRRAKQKPLRDSLERAAQRQQAVDLGMVWRGDWSDSLFYKPGDAVHHECGGFVATKGHSGQEPPSERFWDVLVCPGEKGEKGDTGNTGMGIAGPEGPPGPQGPPGPGGDDLELEDESVPLGPIDTLNFLGAGVSASVVGTTGLVTIAGGAPGSEYPEDSPMQDGDLGNFVLAVRNDTDAVTTDADGDFSQISVDSSGRVKVVGVQTDALTDAELRATPVPVVTQEPISVDDNGGSLTVDGAVSVSNFPAVQPVSDNGGSLTVDGTVAVTGTQTDALTDAELRASPVPVSGTVSVTEPVSVDDNGGSLTVDDGGGSLTVDGTVAITQPVQVVGPAADGAAVSGNPVRMAGKDSGNLTQDLRTDTTGNAGVYAKATAATLLDAAAASQVLPINEAGSAALFHPVVPYGVNGAGTYDRLRTTVADGLLVNLGTNNDVTVTSGNVTADTELPAAAALADNAANPTAPAVGAFGMVWDGANWDRQPGTTADGTLVNLGANNDVTLGAALPAGTNNIGDVDVLSVVPGTGATNLGKAEDAAHTSGDVGVMALGVRNDNVAAAGSGTNGDYTALATDERGQLYITPKVALDSVSGGYIPVTLTGESIQSVVLPRNGYIATETNSTSQVKVAHLDMTTATTTTIVTGVASKKIRVLSYNMRGNENVLSNVTFARGAGTTRCTGSALTLLGSDGRNQSVYTAAPGAWLVETAAGENLRITQDGAMDLSVAITYIEVG